MRTILVMIGLMGLLGGDALAADDIRTVLMADGEHVTGVVVSRDGTFLKLLDASGRTHALLVYDIVEMRELPPSEWEALVAEAPADPESPVTFDPVLRGVHRDLARDGTALAVAPVVPMMATGIVFTIMGGFGDSPPFLGAGIGLTSNSFAASVAGALITRRFTDDPLAGRGAFHAGVVLAVMGMGLLDVGAILGERAGDDRNFEAMGPASALALSGAGLVIAGHASIGSSAIQALEEVHYAQSAPPPVPYASLSSERAVFGVQGVW